VGTRPDGWGERSIEYRFGRSVYAITVHDPARVRAEGAEVRWAPAGLGGDPAGGRWRALRGGRAGEGGAGTVAGRDEESCTGPGGGV